MARGRADAAGPGTGTIYGMAATVYDAAREASFVVADLISTVTVDVRATTTPAHYTPTFHSVRSKCVVEASVRRTVPVLEMQKSCEKCLKASSLARITGDVGDFLAAVVSLRKEFSAAVMVGQARSSILTKRRDALTGVLARVAETRSSVTLTDQDSSKLDGWIRDADNHVAQIDTKLRLGGQAVLDHIRRLLCRPDAVVDDSPVLVGIHSFQPRQWDRDVEALVEYCGVRTDPVVMRVPSYVAFWLASQAAWGRGFAMPVVVTGLTDGEIETAAHLWEPEARNSLRTLAGAVAAARLV